MTNQSTGEPEAGDQAIDYQLAAQAKFAAARHLRITVDADALVAAVRRLSRRGWLSQHIDPRTHYTMRPGRYTPAEQAVATAELDIRKGNLDQSEAEYAAVKAHADRMRRTRTEPAVEPGPATAETDWFQRTMTDAQRREWTTERASDEAAAHSLLAAIRSRRHQNGGPGR